MVESGTRTLTAITSLLRELAAGRTGASDRLLELVYEDLRHLAGARLARRGGARTVQVTDLVHDAWLRLVAHGAPEFESRAHFFGAAANAMRNHMVDLARRKGRIVRQGAGGEDLEDDVSVEPGVSLGEVLAVHEALTKLESTHPRQARIVNLRFFGGLSLAESAELVGVSLATAERDWRFARAWLQHAMGDVDD